MFTNLGSRAGRKRADGGLLSANNLSDVADAAQAFANIKQAATDASSGVVVVLDEDDMSSDSATAVPTQQSVKAYVDANSGGDQDALFFDQRITTLHVAEAVGAPIFSGPDGSAIHDGFDELTYVDVGGATGLDSSTPGLLKPNAGGVETSGEATTTSNIGDSTVLDRSWSVDNGKTVTHMGVYSTSASSLKVKIMRRDSGSDYDVVLNETFSHGGAGWQDFELTTPYTVPGTGTFYAGAHRNGSVNVRASVARTTFVNTDPGGSNHTPTAEDTGNVIPIRVTYSDEDVSVSSTAISAAEVPDTMRGAFRLHDEEGITLNTDMFIDFSRDGGSNWSTATLVEKYTEPGDVRVLDTGDVDVSGQPSGTSLKWRWRTENAVVPELLGATMWGSAS